MIYHRCKGEAGWLPPASRVRINFEEDTKGERIFLIHAPGGPPLGFAAIWEPENFIHHLFIHPEHQGRGLAPRLLAYLEGQILRPWRLKCTLANTRAHRFYLANGWQEKETAVGVDGPYVLMELR